MATDENIGAFWENDWGLNGYIEIDGKKHKIVAFENGYHEAGDNKPKYHIKFAREKAE